MPLILRRLSLEQPLSDWTVVYCEDQQQGKGQRGSQWLSEPGKNLTFSVYKRFSDIVAARSYVLNMAVAKAVVDTLDYFEIPDVSVKWPNDILSGRQKLCGILIETTIKRGQVQDGIIGVGLNVNQRLFGDLMTATSMAELMDTTFDRKRLLKRILKRLTVTFENEISDFLTLKSWYMSRLFGFNISGTFQDENGNFKGVIRDITEDGRIVIERTSGLQYYDIKAIRQPL